MNRTRLLVVFAAFGGTLSPLLGQAPSPTVGQQLLSQYHVSMAGSDGRVIKFGSILAVAQDGIKASPPSHYGCWYNSHKPGNGVKYSTLWEVTTPADLRDQVRLLQVGEKVVVVQLDVKPSEVVFCVQTYGDDPNGIPYRAAMWFQFPQKNYVQPVNLKAIQDSITEVFTLDTSSPTEGPGPALGETTQIEPRAAATRLEQVAGLYLLSEAKDNQLQLNADGTFSLVQLGKNYSGTFKMDGNKLMIRQGHGGPRQAGILQGDTLTDPGNSTWVKQKASPPPPPKPPPMVLPSTYVNAQTPTDQIQLNIDNSFTLQEAGQSYQGTFVASGNTVELNISGGTKTTATIEGNDLTDSGGQKWVKQGVGPTVVVPTVAPLHLPSTYVNAQIPTDQIQLNADNSFSLQEAGQTYRGAFAANGNTLELNIVETNTKTALTIQSSGLTDGSGQAWVLREQTPRVAAAQVLLQNQDVIKMVKAGLDDALIIAKIGTSKCQFDTSTDALIQLKQSGVSGAVLKAIVSAK